MFPDNLLYAMLTVMKKIETENSSFEKLITGGSIYVDKTRYLYNLLRDGGTYYLFTRPHHFGKTLAVSTLKEIFRGRRELFKGLYIDSTDYDWKEYPVIHVDFGLCGAKTAEECETWINGKLDDIASGYGVRLDSSLSYYANLDTLIERLAEREKVVILIDEYDTILSSNIFNPEIEKIGNVLRGFFDVIKASCQNMKFVFITGVTKHSKVSNNLMDLTMDDEYSNMLGYTQSELESYFADYIELGIKKSGMEREEYLSQLKEAYDGYRFSPKGETLYNPVSIGSFFVNGVNYWIDTGGMKLLMDLARKVHFNIADDLEKPITTAKIASYDIIEMAGGNVTRLKYKVLLLQLGYLTIKDTRYNGRELYLDFPNNEVREAYAEVYGSEESEGIFN